MDKNEYRNEVSEIAIPELGHFAMRIWDELAIDEVIDRLYDMGLSVDDAADRLVAYVEDRTE